MTIRQTLHLEASGLLHELQLTATPKEALDPKRLRDFMARCVKELAIPSIQDTGLAETLVRLLLSVADVENFPGRRYCIGAVEEFENMIDELKRLTDFKPIEIEGRIL